ncbi:MAG: SPOR domain-containing protein [Candidatus Schekmanbacteria bacterium]|nr:MAG: SPOR domain-containing protein [Candidatus Schekmanbacteria bacterium]
MKYTVEAGFFKNEKFAKSQMEMLIRKGFDARVDKIKENRKWFFSVRIGSFESEKDAVEILEKLRIDVRLKGKIVKI